MKKALIITGCLGVLGYAVYRYIMVQTALLKDFSYKIIGFNIQNISRTNLAFTLKIRFINQSSIEATVSKLYSDVFVEGKNIGFIVETKSFVIPAKGSSDIDLYFSVQLKEILTNFVDLLIAVATKKDLMFSLRGTAKVSSGFITATIPINFDSSVKEYV